MNVERIFIPTESPSIVSSFNDAICIKINTELYCVNNQVSDYVIVEIIPIPDTDIISLRSSRKEIFKFVESTEEQYFEYMKSIGKVTTRKDMIDLCLNSYISYYISTAEYTIKSCRGYFIGCEELFIKTTNSSPYDRSIDLYTDQVDISDIESSFKNIYYNKINLI